MSGPPWSAPIRLGELKRGPVSLALRPDEGVRARIAESLGLVSLGALEAEVVAKAWLDGAELNGRWSATVIQTCGLSLDDFDLDLRGRFTVRCVPPDSSQALPPQAEIEIDLDAEDPPDVLDGDMIDVGAYVVEHLALELDPFPRKPGAAFEAPPEPPIEHPFAALTKLKLGDDPNG